MSTVTDQYYCISNINDIKHERKKEIKVHCVEHVIITCSLESLFSGEADLLAVNKMSKSKLVL